MPRSGTGEYIAPNSSWKPATNGVLATAGDFTALLNDLSAALTQSVSRDGQSPMQGNLNLSNNKITGLAAGTGATDAATWAQLFGASTQADIASAATTDIGVQNTSFLRVTGTTTITSFGTSYRGPRFLTFEGAVTLTHSSTLVLPGNANITTAAGDSLIVIPGATLGTADKWIVVAYQKSAVVPGYVDMPGGFGFRNRIINGDMRIDQRNAGASITYANNVFPVDRFTLAKSSTAVGTAQRSTTAPAGFTNALLATCTTGASPSAAQYNLLWHNIEGFNVADLGWGTASAQTVTIGFWVRSSLTGTFAATVLNGSFARGYTFNYTVSVANTFEFKTVTIPGDTSGTWATDNSTGIKLSFDLGSGSNSEGTAGAWGSVFYTTSGAQKVMATTGATFYITGVQLEAGSVATPFERRPYGTELALCQRYFETTEVIFTSTPNTQYQTAYWKNTKRSAPTITFTSGAGSPAFLVSGNGLNSFYQSAAPTQIGTAVVSGASEL
jgi:hypothetical protein